MRRLALICVVGAAAVVMHSRAVSAHGLEMLLGSTAKGGGALALSYDFSDRVVVTQSVSIGGTTLYTSLFPGFEWLHADEPADALYALKISTPFSMQIVHIDPGVAVMVGGTTLNADGQTAFVAKTTTVSADHFHPQWELLLPTGVIGTYTVSFRLTTTSRSYAQSQVYALTITNAPLPTETPIPTPTSTMPPIASPTPSSTETASLMPTATVRAESTPTTFATATLAPTTSTPTPTATPTVVALAGDANCDAAVTAADLPRLIDLITMGSPPSCGADANQDAALDQQDIDTTVMLIFESSLP